MASTTSAGTLRVGDLLRAVDSKPAVPEKSERRHLSITPSWTSSVSSLNKTLSHNPLDEAGSPKEEAISPLKRHKHNRRIQVINGLINGPHSSEHLSSVPSIVSPIDETASSVPTPEPSRFRRTSKSLSCLRIRRQSTRDKRRNAISRALRKIRYKTQTQTTKQSKTVELSDDSSSTCPLGCLPYIRTRLAIDQEAEVALRRLQHSTLEKAYAEINELHHQIEDLQRALTDERKLAQQRMHLVTTSWKDTADKARLEIAQMQKQIDILKRFGPPPPVPSKKYLQRPSSPRPRMARMKSSCVPHPSRRLQAISRVRSLDPPRSLGPVVECDVLEDDNESEEKAGSGDDDLPIQVPDLTHSRSSSMSVTPANTPPPPTIVPIDRCSSGDGSKDDLLLVSPLELMITPPNSPLSPRPERKGVFLELSNFEDEEKLSEALRMSFRS